METKAFTDKHAALVERCRLSDRKAQYEVYKLYSRAMFNVSMRMLDHVGEAEDVVQEAFADAFNHIDQFRQTSTFGAWLKQIVINKAITQLRQRKVQWIEIEEWQTNGEAGGVPYENPLSDDNEPFYDVERIRLGMQRLPEGYRTVINLYLFEGYDHEEISGILGISESTSRTQYMRAKQKLLELIRLNNGRISNGRSN